MRAFFLLSVALWGCDPSTPVEVEMPRPDASVLRFDAAMLDPSAADAGMPEPPTRQDAGTDVGRDAGRDGGRDAGYDAGWTAPRFVCRGFASGCSTLSSFSCTDQLGCREEGECSGSARSCSSYTYHSGCIGQDGCYWSSYDRSCRGIPHSCRTERSTSTCRSQDGCRWRETCEGVAWSCDTFFTAESCFTQRGCVWEAE